MFVDVVLLCDRPVRITIFAFDDNSIVAVVDLDIVLGEGVGPDGATVTTANLDELLLLIHDRCGCCSIYDIKELFGWRKRFDFRFKIVVRK